MSLAEKSDSETQFSFWIAIASLDPWKVTYALFLVLGVEWNLLLGLPSISFNLYKSVKSLLFQ